MKGDGAGLALVPSRSLRGTLQDFEMICTGAVSMRSAGCALAWLVVAGRTQVEAFGSLTALGSVLPEVDAGDCAVHRALPKALFPIRRGSLDKLVDSLMGASYEEVISCDFSTAFGEESWVFLSVLFVNWLNGSRGVPLAQDGFECRDLSSRCCTESPQAGQGGRAKSSCRGKRVS